MLNYVYSISKLNKANMKETARLKINFFFFFFFCRRADICYKIKSRKWIHVRNNSTPSVDKNEWTIDFYLTSSYFMLTYK